MLDTVLPFNEPVVIFFIVVFIILVIPYLSRRLKLPSIFGLIMAGLIIGPNGTHIISDNLGVKILSSVGLLYLMFLAGLEINMHSFQKSRNKSLVFGVLTFILPFALGYWVTRSLFQMPFHSSLLIASMFSTHTLISYPIASKMKLTRRDSVVTTIGGTIITDTAVLLLLTIIVASYEGKLDLYFWIQLILSLIAYIFLVLWGIPRLSRWFFTNVQAESSSQYLFVLVVLLGASLLAKLAKIEPIVGAFLSGLALNKVIPQNSNLMNRTTFIGNALFIPFFLVGVGMLINLKVLFSGAFTVLLAAVLILVALTGKYLAALVTQLLFKFSKNDRNLIFGLSASHAAATIAVIKIGFDMHIINEQVLNGTILLVLATCVISSFITEEACRKIALADVDRAEEQKDELERTLVPISNPESIWPLIHFSLVARFSEKAVIYPLTIVNDDDIADSIIKRNEKNISEIIGRNSQVGVDIQPVTRLDINIPTGISRAIKELSINKVILGWSGKSSTANYFFGTIIENLLENTKKMMIVAKVSQPLVSVRIMFVFLPLNAEKEAGFGNLMRCIKAMALNMNSRVIFLINQASIAIFKSEVTKMRFASSAEYRAFNLYPNVSAILNEINGKDIIVAVSARPSTISYDRRFELLPKLLSKHTPQNNYIIIYPEQLEDLDRE